MALRTGKIDTVKGMREVLPRPVVSMLSKLSNAVDKIIPPPSINDGSNGQPYILRSVPVDIKLGSITSSISKPVAKSHSPELLSSELTRGLAHSLLLGVSFKNDTRASCQWRFWAKAKAQDFFTFAAMNEYRINRQGAKKLLSWYKNDGNRDEILKQAQLGSQRIYLVTGYITVDGLKITRSTGPGTDSGMIELMVKDEETKIMIQLHEIHIRVFGGPETAYLGKKPNWCYVGNFELEPVPK